MFEIKITGIVQGVGFRPFIYNNAIKHNIKGYVQNTKNGVKIICDNKQKILKILKNPPKISKIDKIETKIYTPKTNETYKNFTIKRSEKTGTKSYSPIPSDLNLCKDCIKELFDKKNYRHNYFFISCTNCGPRYSIINKTPYDRKNTTLKNFKMCNVCKQEYEDPYNRRFHAQTTACQKCGPKLTLYKNNKPIQTKDPIKKTINLLKQNEIVAIKGTGGFHLACNIKTQTVNKLKQITKRKYKPFALIAKNTKIIQKYCKINEKEKEILLSKQRPIVPLEKYKKNSYKHISELSSLGFMLPSNPIHYLLLDKINTPLIMTSSNLPSNPITTKKEEQIVKYVLDYNREISNFVDDSIVKVINKNPLIIRRSRGFAPNEIQIPSNFQTTNSDILALGAELKNTFCIKQKDKLIISQHIGNTYNLNNFENFKNTVNKLLQFTNSKPKKILHDLNPNFNTTKYAKSLPPNLQSLFPIQHHIAHAFSVALEHNLKNFIAIVCDGTGLGSDNTLWGGEIFHNDKRIGHLEPQILIGGDIANKEPIRMLIGILSKFMKKEEIKKIFPKLKHEQINISIKQKEQNFNCIQTTSLGRVLDCISILLGFSDINYYEGRGAMILESNSSKQTKLFFEPIIKENENNLYELQITPLFEFIIKNLNTIQKEKLARFSQIYIAKGLLEITKKYNKSLPVTFSGGCAYNTIMTSFMLKNKVLLNKEIPTGDGGISAGQISYYLWQNKYKQS